MNRALLLGAALASLVAAPAPAREPDRPITDRDPDVVDVAKTPITDLNVGRDREIPEILTVASQQPYALDGLRRCRELVAEIGRLDEVLGPDIDLPQEERERISGGRMAKWLVASLIPFRGLIREVSGANEQDRKVNAAIQAGLTRRGFLKGVGSSRGCRYPARPAPAAIVQARRDELQVAKDKSGGEDEEKGDLAYKSEPEVRQPPPKH